MSSQNNINIHINCFTLTNSILCQLSNAFLYYGMYLVSQLFPCKRLFRSKKIVSSHKHARQWVHGSYCASLKVTSIYNVNRIRFCSTIQIVRSLSGNKYLYRLYPKHNSGYLENFIYLIIFRV